MSAGDRINGTTIIYVAQHRLRCHHVTHDHNIYLQISNLESLLIAVPLQGSFMHQCPTTHWFSQPGASLGQMS